MSVSIVAGSKFHPNPQKAIRWIKTKFVRELNINDVEFYQATSELIDDHQWSVKYLAKNDKPLTITKNKTGLISFIAGLLNKNISTENRIKIYSSEAWLTKVNSVSRKALRSCNQALRGKW